MWLDASLAYAHFLCVFGLFACLSMEAVVLRPTLVQAAAPWLRRLNIAYGGCAVGAFLSGLSRAYWGIKGMAFYLHQPMFHLKIGLFVLVALMSIVPTRRFIAWAQQLKRLPQWPIPANELQQARRWVLIEIHLLMLVPLCANLMARGLP